MDSYTENEEKKEFPDLDKVISRFKEKGVVKATEQKQMYLAISKNWCIGKSVIDVGCGIGIGTNVLAREAIGAYGIDINKESISFAREMYESPKIKFDVVDMLKEEPRPTATFDVVVCMEIIEHLKDYDLFLRNIKRFYDEKRRTVFFISSPNRNNGNIGKDRPNNEYHVREWQAGDFYRVLTEHFRAVVLYDGSIVDTFSNEETVDGNTEKTPLLAKCEFPIF